MQLLSNRAIPQNLPLTSQYLFLIYYLLSLYRSFLLSVFRGRHSRLVKFYVGSLALYRAVIAIYLGDTTSMKDQQILSVHQILHVLLYVLIARMWEVKKAHLLLLGSSQSSLH